MSLQWYIVHVYSGFEKRVASTIEEKVDTMNMRHLIEEVSVPVEEVVELRRGRKVNSERKFFPGYVLVKMEMTEDSYHLVKNVPKVKFWVGMPIPTIPTIPTRFFFIIMS